MIRVALSLAFLLCLALVSLGAPTNYKSLAPDMSMRQSATGINRPFSSFGGFARRTRRPRRLAGRCRDVAFDQFRTLSGFCNNLARPTQGAASTPFLLLVRPPRSLARGLRGPNPRTISNLIHDEPSETIPNSSGLTELITFFGQILDHTVTFIPTDPNRPLPIEIPQPDPVFTEPGSEIPLFRTETSRGAPLNELSHYVDAASVYGVGEDLALSLRTLSDGLLILNDGLLPTNNEGQFLAGDERVNENGNLMVMHHIWVREHNRVAAEVKAAFPSFDDEELYQLTRHIVAAEFQAVVYFEFLPALTGSLLPAYEKYDPDVVAEVTSAFSTAGYRVGHTLLNTMVTAIKPDGTRDPILLRDSFFNPQSFLDQGLDNLLRGMITLRAAEVDCEITNEVRNFLIDEPDSEEQLDLPALNVQRGRDHRLPTCNDVREEFGLPPLNDFTDLIGGSTVLDENRRTALEVVYGEGNAGEIDTWSCGVCEDHAPGSPIGPLLNAIIDDQFLRLRDGDRFYFETPGYFTDEQIAAGIPTIGRLVGPDKIVGRIFRVILAENSGIALEDIQENPFIVA